MATSDFVGISKTFAILVEMMIETKLDCCCLNGLFLIACGRLVFGGWGGSFSEKKKPEKYDFKTDKGFLSKKLH
jgi:hypothetical protein